MRVSREQAARNHEKVVATAARLFRQHGVDGIGVADLMKAAGLTHGGFYGQFSSKEDLVVQATTRALRENADNRAAKSREKDPWEALKRGYLSMRHYRHPETGCAFTTLAVEAPRRGTALRTALTNGLRAFISDLEPYVPRARNKTTREQAMIALSMMVGAVVLARAVDDEVLAKEILDTVKKEI